jgi:hypothetical protein
VAQQARYSAPETDNTLLSTLILGAVTTLIGNFFINRQKQIAAEREFRAAELKMANKVFDEVSNAMAALAQLSREAMWALVLRPDRKKQWMPEDSTTWAAYNQELASWNRSKARNRALTKKYFGDTAVVGLKQIQGDLATLESRIAATYFGRVRSRDYLTTRNVGKQYVGLSDRLLETDIVALTETMIEKIQKQEVGALTTSNI